MMWRVEDGGGGGGIPIPLSQISIGDFPLALALSFPHVYCFIHSIEEGYGIRRQGKDRRVCLEGRIFSFPCRASCYALVHLKEKVEFIQFFQIDRGKTTSAARN